ncbi:Shedu immune nuclease family protein [Nocardioides sp. LML1-1-1.1]|uniref:Shedu immune nuclease family protein n=1 Tax=Nocardioides sp. LML1-1-1.1 TaxID=3135248 RepID=UPI00342DFA0E
MSDGRDAAAGERRFGEPAQFFYDLDRADAQRLRPGLGGEWHVGRPDASDQFGIRVLARYGADGVEEVWIVRIADDGQEVETLIHVAGDQATQFVEVFRSSAFEPTAEGLRPTLEPELVPGIKELTVAYHREPEAMRALIEGDATAHDVIAVAHRKVVVTQFRRMLDEPAFFANLESTLDKTEEGVWQHFFESHPWLLGLGLSEHLLLGWDPTKLEQTVAGQSITSAGKRTDALLRTAGLVRMLAFAEIKHHETPLLASRTYRSGCWAPGMQIVGAVAQSQGTVQLAWEQIGKALRKAASEQGGGGPISDSHFYRPRAFVVAGALRQFVSETGQVDVDKVRSFELYRRNVTDPVILTFDEVLARAEVAVAAAGGDAVEERLSVPTDEVGTGPQSDC